MGDCRRLRSGVIVLTLSEALVGLLEAMPRRFGCANPILLNWKNLIVLWLVFL